MPDMKVGDEAEVHDLHGAKYLNGRRGTILTFVQSTGRFGVLLEGDRDNKAIRPEHLLRIREADWTHTAEDEDWWDEEKQFAQYGCSQLLRLPNEPEAQPESTADVLSRLGFDDQAAKLRLAEKGTGTDRAGKRDRRRRAR